MENKRPPTTTTTSIFEELDVVFEALEVMNEVIKADAEENVRGIERLEALIAELDDTDENVHESNPEPRTPPPPTSSTSLNH